MAAPCSCLTVEIAAANMGETLQENQISCGQRQVIPLASKPLVMIAAILVFGICAYSFLLGNGVFKGRFENDPIGWYFLAKGIFCALSLYLTQSLLEAMRNLRK
jgi:hypothetical protein